jgi:ribose/xylose/arabinose/galactoside ABC-type transport system permease subunit
MSKQDSGPKMSGDAQAAPGVTPTPPKSGGLPAWARAGQALIPEGLPAPNPRVIGLVVSILAAAIVFTLVNPNFALGTNLIGLVRAMSSMGIMALGLTLLIIAGELDLSIGATYGLAAMLMGKAWLAGVPFAAALAIGLGIGLGVGLANALLTTVVRMPSFVATLGTLNVAQGATLLISEARGINPGYSHPPVDPRELEVFRALGATSLPLGIPIQVLWLLVLSVVVGLLLHRSLFGFRLFAIGGNVEAARTARLPIRRYKFIAFMLAGLLAALAGILDFSFLGSTDPSAGLPLLFPVFAAVIVGGASLRGGRGTIIGTFLGALLLAVLGNGLSVIGVGAFGQLMFVGLAILGAVALDRWTARKSEEWSVE